MNKVKNRHTYIHKITPLTFCGKQIAIAEGKDFATPFEISSTEGTHDYRTCQTCQKNLVQLTDEFTRKFNGTNEGKKPFPDCCEHHQKLKNLPSFNYDSYKQVPVWVAQKIIYTSQHVENFHAHADWYVHISHYIDSVYESFGSMPVGYGEALYLGDYFHHVTHMIRNNKDVPSRKRKAILRFIEGYTKQERLVSPNFVELIRVYERWIEAFPFRLTFFKPLREEYENNIPLMTVESEVNIYSGLKRTMLHSEETLTQLLLQTTKDLLLRFKTHEVLKEVAEVDQIKFGLDIEEHRMIQETLLGSFTKNELAYRELLERWLTNERRFFKTSAYRLKRALGSNKAPVVASPKPTAQDELKQRKNVSFKAIPMSVVVEHFSVFLQTNKKGLPYLKHEEFQNFILRGFAGEVDLPKVKVNCASGEKGKVIKRFYQFFDLAVGSYGLVNKKEPFLKLIEETIDNGWSGQSITSFFKPKKVKEDW